MKLTILVPVYNEENTIKTVLTKLLSVRLPWKKEIIIIDDGSTDDTRSILRNFQKRSRDTIKNIRHRVNQGKGKALQSGIVEATGDYILIQDADLEYNPEEIRKLLQPLLKRKKSKNVAVYGSRFKYKKFG